MSTPLAYFGINSSVLSLVIDLAIIFAVVLYLSLIFWTVQDARRRIAQPVYVGCAFVISLVPFLGPIIYTVLRPPEFLDDVNQREIEVRAAQARLQDPDHQLCPHCNYRIERDFLRCPSCLRRLREPCSACSRPLDPFWTICPYCETEVPGATPPRVARREARETRRRAGTQRERERMPLTENPYRSADSYAASESYGPSGGTGEETQAFTVDPFAIEDLSTGIDRSDESTRSSLPLAPDPAPRERGRRRPRAGDQ